MNDTLEPITHRYLSIEQLLTTLVLLGGIVASFTLLSAKVDGLTVGLSALSNQEAIVSERLRTHELLPMHPVAKVELENLNRRIHELETKQVGR